MWEKPEDSDHHRENNQRAIQRSCVEWDSSSTRFSFESIIFDRRMTASSPLNHMFISPLKILVGSSQEKLKKRNILECFVSVEFPGYFNSKSESERYFHWI